MLAPINEARLDSRIRGFLARKDKRYPEMNLLGGKTDDRPANGSGDRADTVWFRTIKAL